MDILEHPLVLKYFTSEYKAYYPVMGDSEKMDAAAWDKCALAARVLDSMQQPIRKGDRILRGKDVESLNEGTWTFDQTIGGAWPWLLKLPDRFQEKKECGCGCLAPKDPVEEIKKLIDSHPELRAPAQKIFGEIADRLAREGR